MLPSLKVPGGGDFPSSLFSLGPAVGFGGSGAGFWWFCPAPMAEGSALSHSVNLPFNTWCVGETHLAALGSYK